MANETSSPARPSIYAPPARWIHWIVAILVLAIIPAGFVMVRLGPGALQDQLFSYHESIGILIFALALARVLTRALNPVPGRPAGMPVWMWGAAELTHYALYALIIVMPILGWLTATTFGAPVSVFGLFTMPSPLGKNEALSDVLGTWHERGGYLMAGLVALHIAAGLYHGVVKQDGVLSRMLPFLSR
ncbi:cytochrome b [Xanthobacter pseudotagetidis]|uniref:cytochrome b n=1 Tax=Xanthobacter pseudotagetidis TaxID=3119911 RepID=UPI00372B0713